MYLLVSILVLFLKLYRYFLLLYSLSFASATSNYFIAPSSSVDFERFGHSIAASEDYLVVGTYSPSANARVHQFMLASRENASAAADAAWTQDTLYWQEIGTLAPVGPPVPPRGRDPNAFSYYGSSVALYEGPLPGSSSCDGSCRVVVAGSPSGGVKDEGQVWQVLVCVL